MLWLCWIGGDCATFFKQDVEFNHPGSLWMYGYCLWTGSGVSQNQDEAKALFKRAATLKHKVSLTKYIKILENQKIPSTPEEIEFFKSMLNASFETDLDFFFSGNNSYTI
jgi:hypothetical protein